MRPICHFHNSAASERKSRPSQSPSSGQCAPHSFGVESLLPRRGHSIDAYLHRGAAMMPPDRVAKTASHGFAVFEVGETVEVVAATAACGGQPSACRPTRFTSCSRRARPQSPLPSGTFCSDVRQHGVSVGLRRSCARPPKLAPASPFVPAGTLLAATVTTPWM